MPETAHEERQRAEGGKDEERHADRHFAAVNAVNEDGVKGERNGERDGVEDAAAFEAKGERGQRRKEEGGADECRGLAGGCNPWMEESARKIPEAELVDLHHAQAREEKAKEPKQGARVAGTQVKLCKRR